MPKHRINEIKSKKFCCFVCVICRVEEGVQSNDLMATNVSVIPRKICLSRYSGKISRHAFCAGSLEGEKEKDTCQVCWLIVVFNETIGVYVYNFGCLEIAG